ncbi:MAG: hypothetical protein GY817_00880 [bacterium]|nr:hypothetical protein [bacterium]
MYIQLLEEHRITIGIFENIFYNVYAYDVWVNGIQTFKKDFEDCKALVVLNKWNYQGFIFYGGYEILQELGKLDQEKTKLMFGFHINQHTGSIMKKRIKDIENSIKRKSINQEW